MLNCNIYCNRLSHHHLLRTCYIKTLILSAVHWTETRGPRLRADWSSGYRCAAYRRAKRSEKWQTMFFRPNKIPVRNFRCWEILTLTNANSKWNYGCIYHCNLHY
jgi:hypothetical protein